MTRARVACAVAAIVTALLVQATVVGPASLPWAVSLPAVLVAAVALFDGPGTGMSMGFACGLAADLGSHHAAGVLALTWLGVGLLCGRVADRRSVRRDAILAGTVCGLASVASTLVLAVLPGGGAAATARTAFTGAVPAVLGDIVLALLITPLVRAMLGTESLRAPLPVRTELLVGPHA